MQAPHRLLHGAHVRAAQRARRRGGSTCDRPLAAHARARTGGGLHNLRLLRLKRGTLASDRLALRRDLLALHGAQD